MKEIVIVFVLIMFASLAFHQQAFGFVDSSIKEEKQFAMGLFLVGFVGIYGFTIYFRKSRKMKIK